MTHHASDKGSGTYRLGFFRRLEKSLWFHCLYWVVIVHLLEWAIIMWTAPYILALWGRYDSITPLQIERRLYSGATVSDMFASLTLGYAPDKSLYNERHSNNKYQVIFNQVGYGRFFTPQHAYVFTFDKNKRLESVLVETYDGRNKNDYYLNLQLHPPDDE